VSLYRDLASANPEVFQPDLAMSLSNLAYVLDDLGRREEALSAAQEAVSLYRDLAAARPEAFRPNLAGSLCNLSVILGETKQKDQAVESCREAVELIIPFVLAIPAAFGERMVNMVGWYLHLIEETGHQPNFDLLAPLVKAGFFEIETEDSTSPYEATSHPEEEPQ
jgi:tetratricopeptide (TPR) repeat protein